jgi:hypothetical protein
MKSLLLLLQKIERWFLSSNAKDIGVLYLMFALFSGWLPLLDIMDKEDLILIVPIVASSKLNPWFITGFVDAEGSFQISIIENKKYKTGWAVSPKFQIGLHEKDRALLELIQTSLGVGTISKQGKDSLQFWVKSIKDLEVILNQLDKYSLITKKRADYLLFKQALELIKTKEHLTQEGLEKLVAIKASMNWGLRDALKSAFPSIIPVVRPLVNPLIPDPNWIAGFASGEGCFMVSNYKSKTILGETVGLRFSITQHVREEELLKVLTQYLDCGICHNSQEETLKFIVIRFSDIKEKIIPFFNKYPILGIKSKDFLDFKKVVELMGNKEHLTLDGLEEIRKIKSGMNKGRDR